MKFKKIISFVVCLLVLLNIPGILLETQSIAVSSPVSYFIFFLLGVLIITNKTKFPKQILFMAGISSLYFFIGAFQYEESFIALSINYVKFLLYLFGLFVSLKHINQNTIIFLLLAGAITILLDSLYFRFNDFQGIGYVSQYGRYSGFYLNPNTASMICLFGYVLSITKTNYLKLLSIAFTFFGFITLSRTFMATWFLITIIYLFYNRKYIVKTFLFLIVSVFSLITFSENLNLDTRRFDFLVNLFSGQINNEVLNDNSRQYQWGSTTTAVFVAQGCDKLDDLHILTLNILIVTDISTSKRSLLTFAHPSLGVNKAVVEHHESRVRPSSNAEGWTAPQNNIRIDSFSGNAQEPSIIGATTVDSIGRNIGKSSSTIANSTYFDPGLPPLVLMI